LSYTLHPFSEKEQVLFLKKSWLRNSNIESIIQHLIQTFATALVRKLSHSISEKYKEFTGIPLQTRMKAEAFEEYFRLFYLSEKSERELPHKLDLLGLYRRFIKRKYYIYYTEK
jgi:plasmid stabilization system protein ParE